MRFSEYSSAGVVYFVLALCLLAVITQCSPPPPAPSQSGEEWGLAAEHDNVLLLSAIGGSSEYPTWSPDGTKIAFQHIEDRFGPTDDLAPRDIYVMDSDGREARRLTHGAENGISCEHPSWAPDSSRLVCSCNADGDYDLYIVDVASDTLTQLTDLIGAEEYPAWSPDGTRIAFASDMDTEGRVYTATVDITPTSVVTITFKGSIYTVASDGTDIKRLTMGPDDSRPIWSPDSQKLAFIAVESGIFVGNLCTIDLDGSELACYESVRCGLIAWSPDGSRIACTQKRQIVTIEVDGEEMTTLLQTEHNFLSGISWSPDGKRLVFTAGVMSFAANEIYVLEVEP